MIEDDRRQSLPESPSTFAVAPVRRRHAVPRLVLVALAVGVVAFTGGLVVAGRGSQPPARAAQASSPSPSSTPGNVSSAGALTAAIASTVPAPSVAPGFDAPLAQASPTAAPGSSGFITGFDPASIVASVEGGNRCTTAEPLDNDVPRTRRDGPRLTFQRSWMLYCRIDAPDRQAFLIDLFAALQDRVPADTYGYQTTTAGAGDALFPYADQPMAGTVAVHADAAGKGLAVAVVVQEWRPDAN